MVGVVGALTLCGQQVGVEPKCSRAKELLVIDDEEGCSTVMTGVSARLSRHRGSLQNPQHKLLRTMTIPYYLFIAYTLNMKLSVSIGGASRRDPGSIPGSPTEEHR